MPYQGQQWYCNWTGSENQQEKIVSSVLSQARLAPKSKPRADRLGFLAKSGRLVFTVSRIKVAMQPQPDPLVAMTTRRYLQTLESAIPKTNVTNCK